MYRGFSKQDNYRWFDMLAELMKSYNNIVRRTIGMNHSQVSDAKEPLVMKCIEKNTAPKTAATVQAKFKTGDRVRISKHKITVAKGYTANWTN